MEFVESNPLFQNPKSLSYSVLLLQLGSVTELRVDDSLACYNGVAKSMLPSWGGDQYQKTMGAVPKDTSWINEKVKSTPPADSDTPKKRARKSSGSKKDNKETEYASEEGKAKSETEDPKAAEEEEDNEGNNDSRGKQLENGDKTEQI
ncbi:hypothetical protein JHK84_040527 [Glycine max]|nr:hypothetical protein JHK84_040527 [Glycine max]